MNDIIILLPVIALLLSLAVAWILLFRSALRDEDNKRSKRKQ